MYNVIGMWKNRNKPGFTIIELLVTIGLIGILSAGVISLIGQGPREGSRDTRRQADLQSIVSGVTLFRNDMGKYPSCGGSVSCEARNMVGMGNYMATIPRDPADALGRDYRYKPMDSGSGACDASNGDRCVKFVLCAALERNTTADSNCNSLSCGSGFTCSLSVASQ